MKSAFILAAVSGLASASPFFSLLSIRSASPIHYGEIVARGESLWIGKKTGSFCPSNVEKLGGCPPGKHTNFAGGNGGLGMGKSPLQPLFDCQNSSLR